MKRGIKEPPVALATATPEPPLPTYTFVAFVAFNQNKLQIKKNFQCWTWKSGKSLDLLAKPPVTLLPTHVGDAALSQRTGWTWARELE